MAVDCHVFEEKIPLPVTPMLAAGLHRFSPRQGDVKGTVLLLHGLMQSGDVFYDQSRGGGLAYYLVEQGYEVFVCLLRGRDASRTQLRQDAFGLKQIILEDLPMIWSSVQKRCRHQDVFLAGYQLGGPLWSALLARQPEVARQVRGIIHFSPQRAVVAGGRRKQFWHSLVDKALLPGLGRLLGFIPAPMLGLGQQNESAELYRDVLQWRMSDWQDSWDGFNYSQALSGLDLPPSLYFVSVRPRWRQLDNDCRAYMQELGAHNARMIKLGSREGNQMDYPYRELASHLQAESDYFPLLLSWMRELQSGCENTEH